MDSTTLTIGGITLGFSSGSFVPFASSVPHTVYDGLASTTIQVGAPHIKGSRGSLNASLDNRFLTPGEAAAIDALKVASGGGTAHAYADSLGNVGTVLLVEATVEGQFDDACAVTLAWVWVTITYKLGASYTGP